ncbi:uncharacterized protein F4807DRAFT_207104 [Annulohypoxylon truncatum]|uniref:uncharacterized protein n=1 Tax=Annulohypoxylon truncatum TaxID=327061 RepID=UPI002007D261|nr:uncharacterized protein F4807DRAFT_207104 [Annulohypoxylon truncatum]KAI1213961.1 hypothetical protein F4807DRAFT_207104 [Annulohypoxylon truncatum]
MAPHTFTTSTLSLLMLLGSTPISLCQDRPPPSPVESGAIPSFTAVPGNNTREGPNGLRIVDSDEVYHYAGCWSETTEFSPHTRALDGVYLTAIGQMQVKPCIDYCARSYNHFHPETKGWKYAGLEFARECWCGDSLSPRSLHLQESACDTPCDGANSTVCGGHLAITLYNATTPDTGRPGTGTGDETTEPPKSAASGSKTSGATSTGSKTSGAVSSGSKTSGAVSTGSKTSDASGSKTSDASTSKPGNEAVAQAVGVGLVLVAVTFVLGMGCL